MTTVIGCTYVQKVNDGSSALERKQYDVAVSLLKKEYNKEKSRVLKGKKAFALAEAYQAQGRSEDAVDWYKKAYDFQYGVEALEQYAFALKQIEEYDEAIGAFTDLGFEIGSPYEYRKEISACKIAKNWLENPDSTFVIDAVKFNSIYADYAPTLYGENSLVFTSDRDNSTGDEKYKWTGRKFSDLYVADLKHGEVLPFDDLINTAYNEGTASFNLNRDFMVFTRCFDSEKREDRNCKLMMSKRTGSLWSAPSVLPFVKDGVNYRQPFVINGGKTVYFASDDPEGWGGYDIYVCHSIGEDAWSEPSILPLTINSDAGDEGFPFLDEDTLYFASNGHLGMGGYDIFRSFRQDKRWAPNYNLKAPINSSKDDLSLVLNPKITQHTVNGHKVLSNGFFASSRGGRDDIYEFQKLYIPTPTKPIVFDIEYTYTLNVYVLEKIYQVPNDPNSPMIGRKPLADAQLSISHNNKSQNYLSNAEGLVSIEVELNQNYSLIGSHINFLASEATFSTIGIGKDPDRPNQVFEKEVELDKIYFDKEITLQNIYYDFDKADIRLDAQPTLDMLVRNLNLNPKISIELASHTDCRGQAGYNQNLSQRRAQNAINYLIDKGIDPLRLRARGYGKSKPNIDCLCSRCTEEEHQANRRTTFKILQ